MQHSVTEIRFSSPGGKVNVYLFCKPQYILEALLLRDCKETSPLHHFSSPIPHLFSHTHTHTNEIASAYVLVHPVNFLSRVHRWADISGINLLLRIVMPVQMYTRFLSLVDYCVWVLVHTGNGPLCLCGQPNKGRIDMWDLQKPKFYGVKQQPTNQGST